MLFGGGHENERRAGTENLAGIVGLVRATETFASVQPVFQTGLVSSFATSLRNKLRSISGVRVVENEGCSLCNTVAFCVEGSDSIALLAGLDMEGICASSGSACSAGSLEPSHVIRALGWGNALANALVRFSLGRENTAADISLVADCLETVIRRSQLGQ
jgi:cysteine desulfurase